MDEEIVEVLKDIRGEAKQMNRQLAAVEDQAKQMNVRLAAVEGETKQMNVQLAAVEVEAKEMNMRLAAVEDEAKETNVRLASLEGRVEFLEKRTTQGLSSLTERLDSHAERFELIVQQQAQSEIRLATEVLSLADVTRDVRDLLSRKLDDHHMVLDHEERISTLESRLPGR